jgi:hypothetical protein
MNASVFICSLRSQWIALRIRLLRRRSRTRSVSARSSSAQRSAIQRSVGMSSSIQFLLVTATGVPRSRTLRLSRGWQRGATLFNT